MNRFSVSGQLYPAVLMLTVFATQVYAAGALNVVNWSDYISPTTVETFTKESGISVNYTTINSDEWLQTRLYNDRDMHDVVYPSSTFMARQIRAGVYEKLDWSKLPNGKGLDPALMAKVAKQDPGNLYGVPYIWGTDGLLVNTTKVQALLGKAAISNSWNLLFDLKTVSKLSACGVSMPDSATDVFPVVLAYMGRDPNSKNQQDYKDAYQHLLTLRPYIAQFNSLFQDDMAAGKLCVAFGWSGDAGYIQQQMTEAKVADKLVYLTPKGQTGMWFTMMGIPRYARNKDAAYQWLNFILRADVAADITNQTTYPTGVLAGRTTIDPSILNNQIIFPSDDRIAEFFVFEPMDSQISVLISTLWSRLKLAH